MIFFSVVGFIFLLIFCNGYPNQTEKPKNLDLRYESLRGNAEPLSDSEESSTTINNSSSFIQENDQGEATIVREKRVIKGAPVDQYSYPYVVSLRDFYGHHVCGGSIITPRMILTAAHCLPFKPMYIRVSDIYYSEIWYEIELTIKHNFFDLKTLSHDIALLVLKYEIYNAQTVKLLRGPELPKNTMFLEALGWGLTEHGRPSRKLNIVKLPLMHPSYCERTYGFSASLSSYRICVGSHWGNVCVGDSGGPLMWKDTQVGITSFGEKNYVNTCMARMPTVFTRISAYYEWIQIFVHLYG